MVLMNALRRTPLLAARGRRCVSTSDLPSHLKSVRVNVADDVALHAIVPVEKPSPSAGHPPILCLPSAFGSVIHNFRHQFTALSEEFEFIGVDPRGYGFSRPPERDFPDRYFERDADDVARAMDALGYDKFSILGWSAGANTGAVFAARHPDRVERLVLVNGNAFVDMDDAETYEEFEDIDKWHPASRDEGIAIYGAENLQKGWSSMMHKLKSIYDDEGGDLYCGSLPQIRCKTLVVAGGKDRLVPEFHGEYLNERIMHSKLHVFPNGRHDVHIQEAAAFNQLLEQFLTEPDDKHTQSREFVARPAT
ncbi:hypothetical protein Poli38472_012469 [Pythium oligandrum]|uniref:AB hydrolase-1 domain-containing protein n=1 Tax=Pythium oligandrum TaxID=41045 RepID=A0A8K1CQX8_PYTOL|nr:hypothetical protein Poli38472_012469 [Pythium oligandrum]|eukprot:TMW67353.1 hypothetical protein Poli38472_012469 [Pythium oligandrum]